MPTRPAIKATTGLYTSVGIINSILNDPENDLLYDLPRVENTVESIRMIGEEITSFAPRRNQFASALVNRIGMMRLNYMLFNNPWAIFKQGKLEMGETVEQIFVGLAEVFPYDPKESESRFPKRVAPDIQTAFHTINYAEVYKTTISTLELKKAFLSLGGMVDLTETLVSRMAASAGVDEFIMMKYLFALLLLDGKIDVVNIPEITRDTAADVVAQIAEITNLMQFPSGQRNMAGVENTTPISNLQILESARANALVKTNVLATAFNREYVEFLGQVTMFDSLASINFNRLDKLMSKDKAYRKFTTDELKLLESVQFIACDRQFFQVYDSVAEMEEPFRNGEGAYTNYFYHVQQIYSASPFHNCVAFATVDSSVDSVTISPDNATAAVGSRVAFQANVITSGFAGSGVFWEISSSDATNSQIGQDGILLIGDKETANSINIKATSLYDESKNATATITITNAVALARSTAKK